MLSIYMYIYLLLLLYASNKRSVLVWSCFVMFFFIWLDRQQVAGWVSRLVVPVEPCRLIVRPCRRCLSGSTRVLVFAAIGCHFVGLVWIVYVMSLVFGVLKAQLNYTTLLGRTTYTQKHLHSPTQMYIHLQHSTFFHQRRTEKE